MEIRIQWKECLSEAISPCVLAMVDSVLRHEDRYLATTSEHLSFVTL